MKSLLQVFGSYRMFICLLVGFSGGIPLGLTGGTLQAWMASEKVDLTLIGLFSLVGLPYTLKFIWAPLMDRYVPPFLGRRRGWLFVTQIALAGAIAAMAFSNPVIAPGAMAVMALAVSFSSASQDIVIDAYRTELLSESERGAGSALYIMGYRLAMIVSGALALILSDHIPWSSVYLIMAGCIGVGVIASLFGPEPILKETAPKTLAIAVWGPFVEYFKRRGAFEILLFIVFYKLGDVLTGMMTTPFMIQIGFTKTDIGAVNKGLGVFATIIGTLTGGALMARFGMRRSLWTFGIMQALSNLCFMILAYMGHHYPTMVSAIVIENLCSGMGTAAFSAFLMSLCNTKFTATQYALLTSFMAFSRVFITAPSGWMAKNLGWEHYFLFTSMMAIPGLFLLLRYNTWTRIEVDSHQA